jgi:peptidylprolyl isomerase
VGALAIVALALAGTVEVAAPSVGAAADPLTQVKVTGKVGKKPTITFAKPFSASSTTHRVVAAGTGAAVAQGNKITMNYLIVDGRTGKQIASTYGGSPVGAILDATDTATPLVDSLVGANVGSRVLVAVSPKDGLANTSTSIPGVKKTDSLLFLIDLESIRTVLPRATGTPVTPPPGLPTVTLDPATGKPSIAVPGTPAPTSLVVQPLITGTGPTVAKGQTLTVHYTGVVWASGKQFDSSWDRGTPADFQIGTGKVIKGWDDAIVGKTVGSQLLLVVPPSEGYGTSGNSSAGISGTDTLVFVVDILDAY